MQEDLNQSLQSLLNQHLIQVGKFKEHVQLVSKATPDDGLKAFFNHLIEEEDEREKKLQALIQKAKAIPSAVARQTQVQAPPVTPGTETHVQDTHSHGHFALRDSNVLTVGSLLGQRQ